MLEEWFKNNIYQFSKACGIPKENEQPSIKYGKKRNVNTQLPKKLPLQEFRAKIIWRWDILISYQSLEGDFRLYSHNPNGSYILAVPMQTKGHTETNLGKPQL